MSWLIQSGFYAAVLLFIFGLKRMGHPSTARTGIIWAGIGMVIATVVTFLLPDISGIGKNLLIIVGVAIGSIVAWISGKRVQMTDMPQMVALYNGMGGGSAACIGAVSLFQAASGSYLSTPALALGILGSLIGAVSFSANGKLVITGGGRADPSIKAWDLEENRLTCTISGNSWSRGRI